METHRSADASIGTINRVLFRLALVVGTAAIILLPLLLR